MKKNDITVQTADKQLNDEKLKKREAKKAALKAKREAKKQKEAEKKAAAKAKREAKKAKKAAKLQKLKEKKAAKKAAAKAKHDAKKAKKLARLQKQKEKKAALKAKKQAARQKKLAREAKKRAKIKEQKQKAREKAKLQKQKLEAKQKKAEAKQKKAKTEMAKPENTEVSINEIVKTLKAYIRKLAKDGVDDKTAKKLKWLGFTFDDETAAFQYSAKIKTKKPEKTPKQVKPAEEAVEPASDIDAAVAEVMDGKSEAVEALAAELETDNEDKPTEVPIGDTFSDNVSTDINDETDAAGTDDDDTIEDFRDEDDPDKVDFRHDWNNEFDDDGERNEDW